MRHLAIILLLAAALQAQRPLDQRPGLFFREDWKETPAETPVTQNHVANADVKLALYGPGKDGIKKSHHDTPADDPFYIWFGTCNGNCAITLRHKTKLVDLTGLAHIRWRARQTGIRQLHLVLKLAGGSWLVSQEGDGPASDWREQDFVIRDLHWNKLDSKTVLEGAPVENPDLSRVEELGWTDLMTGGGTPASSRLDWIEVYGKATPASVR